MHQFLGRLSELDFLYISLHGYDANIEDAAIAHKRSDGSEALPLCPLAAATLFLQPDQKLLHKLEFFFCKSLLFAFQPALAVGIFFASSKKSR